MGEGINRSYSAKKIKNIHFEKHSGKEIYHPTSEIKADRHVKIKRD